ncbi:hypothetical protein ACAG26_24405 [Mycobacterium sp. pUA109]|uniref:hypothetical protein n=1 Tax=Mycobacterium sp. pUA109 TaxID=3238982 RepID=UPI00351BD3E7
MTAVNPNVAYDATGAGSHASATSLSWTHVIGSTANAILVAASAQNTSSSVTASATAGGTSMTLLEALTFYNLSTFSYYRLYVWGLLNPPNGSQAVTITMSASSALAANSVSYIGVGSFGTVATNAASSATASLSVPAATGDIVFCALASVAENSSFSSFNQTSRWNQAGVNNTCLATVIGDAPGASTVSFSASQASTYFGAVGVPLIP